MKVLDTLSRVRILFAGNSNNLPFAIALETQRLGHAVEVIVTNHHHLNDPSNFDNQHHDVKVTLLPFASEEESLILDAKRNRILNYVLSNQNRFDFIFLSDVTVGFGTRLTTRYGILVTGNEIVYYGASNFAAIRSSGWPLSTTFSPRSMLVKRRYKTFMKAVRQSFIRTSLIRTLPLVYWLEADDFFRSIQLPREIFFDDIFFFRLRGANMGQPISHTPYFLSGTRICIDRSSKDDLSNLDVKGTDILLDGFAIYVRSGGTGFLGLFEKGPDVARAKILIDQLGITSRVVWNPEVPLPDFSDQVAHADVILDQLTSHSVPGLVTGISYHHAKPVIANFRREIQGRYLDLPGISITSAKELAEAFMFCELNPQHMAVLGQDGQRVLLDRFSITNYVERLLSKVLNTL